MCLKFSDSRWACWISADVGSNRSIVLTMAPTTSGWSVLSKTKSNCVFVSSCWLTNISKSSSGSSSRDVLDSSLGSLEKASAAELSFPFSVCQQTTWKRRRIDNGGR